MLGDKVANRLCERTALVSEVVRSTEPHQARPLPGQAAAQNGRELVQVDVRERDPVAELVPADGEAPVADRPLVDGACGRASSNSYSKVVLAYVSNVSNEIFGNDQKNIFTGLR